MNCQTCHSELPNLLLDPAAANADVRAHLDFCPACQKEFDSLQATFALLDIWQAPEPSAYFNQKLAARLREEQAMPPASWLEQLQTRLLFNTGRQFRPAMVGALAFLLLLGGGTFAGISNLSAQHNKAQVSAAVGDLQILDKNDQALQEMDQLFQDDDSSDDNPVVPPLS
jgi:anti-sigma factor RsiW